MNYSEPKISTITAVSNINTIINLNNLFENCFIDKKFVYVEYGNNKNLSNFKGDKPQKKKPTKKRFDNQLTIIYSYDNNNVNIKLFKNGKIQMTGLKSIEQGKETTINLINYIKIHQNIYKNIIEDKNENKNENQIKTIENDYGMYLSNYKICLINADFKINFKIKRKDLFNYLLNNTDLIVSFEPCIYPGVKIQFFYNNNENGICNCNPFCSRKNKMNCSKITIAIFESGCIIITGSKHLKHTNLCFNFIKNIIISNKKLFEKFELVPRLLF